MADHKKTTRVSVTDRGVRINAKKMFRFADVASLEDSDIIENCTVVYSLVEPVFTIMENYDVISSEYLEWYEKQKLGLRE